MAAVVSEFLMPELGESVESGTVTRWLRAVGESVTAGEPLLEVATDKVDTEISSPITGTLIAIHVEEDELASIGQRLASFGVGSGEPDAGSVLQTPIAEVELEHVSIPAVAAEPDFVAASTPSVADSRVEKLTGIRRIISERMMSSLRNSAQLTSVVEVNVTNVKRRREAARQNGSELSYFAAFAEASVRALASHPAFNTTIDSTGSDVTYWTPVHLGIAVDTSRGLMVPVLRHAEKLDAVQLTAAIAELALRTRESRVSAEELSGGTFTLTNTGSRGALFDTPILNSPQTAILGTGAIVDRVVPISRDPMAIVVGSFAYFSLTYDHRVVDGADAARFLTTVKGLIESSPDQAEP